jgi:hypothetical protein
MVQQQQQQNKRKPRHPTSIFAYNFMPDRWKWRQSETDQPAASIASTRWLLFASWQSRKPSEDERKLQKLFIQRNNKLAVRIRRLEFTRRRRNECPTLHIRTVADALSFLLTCVKKLSTPCKTCLRINQSLLDHGCGHIVFCSLKGWKYTC